MERTRGAPADARTLGLAGSRGHGTLCTVHEAMRREMRDAMASDQQMQRDGS